MSTFRFPVSTFVKQSIFTEEVAELQLIREKLIGVCRPDINVTATTTPNPCYHLFEKKGNIKQRLAQVSGAATKS